MSEKLNQLKEKLGEVDDIGKAASVLGWDQQVNMPPGGNEARGQQLATLSKIAQEPHQKRPDLASAGQHSGTRIRGKRGGPVFRVSGDGPGCPGKPSRRIWTP